MDKGQILDSGWMTYLWVVGISVWGGIVSFYEKDGGQSFARLIGHLLSASFAGVMTYYLCKYGNVPEPLIGVFCGIAAYKGTPALLRLKWVRTLLDNGGTKE